MKGWPERAVDPSVNACIALPGGCGAHSREKREKVHRKSADNRFRGRIFVSDQGVSAGRAQLRCTNSGPIVNLWGLHGLPGCYLTMARAILAGRWVPGSDYRRGVVDMILYIVIKQGVSHENDCGGYQAIQA